MTPSNSVRYKKLLEGIEAAVIQRSSLNSELRFEAEFFRKQYLVEDFALKKLPSTSIGDFAAVTDGPHGYHVVDEESPVAMLTAKNAKDWFAERESADTIAKETHEANLRSSLEYEDIILSTRGTVGLCALVLPEVLPANLDQDVARISWSDRDRLLPEYVLTYLNSTFGQDYIHRYATGMVQQGLSLQKVREIPIPLLSVGFQKQVKTLVRSALESRRSAKTEMDRAEEHVLEALGARNWRPPEPLTYTQNSSNVFAANRCDAEFFYPAKSAALKLLRVGKYRHLGELYESIREMFDPAREHPATLVRNFDLTDALQPVLDDSKAPIEAVMIGSMKKIFKSGDVAISRLRSYLREIAVVRTSSVHLAVGSSEFIVLRPQPGMPSKLSPEALLVFLRSYPVQMVLKWSQDGSNHPRFGDEALLQVPIPDVVVQLVPKLKAAVDMSLKRRAQSQDLLQKAKAAVETAIKKGESTALKQLTADGK